MATESVSLLQEVPELSITDAHRTQFATVLEEFREDQSSMKLLQEYERLYDALKDAHIEYDALQQKYRHLQNEIKSNAEKVNLAVHLSQEERGIISALTKQANDAWALFEEIQNREADTGSAIRNLKGDISLLATLVKEGTGFEELQSISTRAALERSGLDKAIVAMKKEMDADEIRHAETMDRMKSKEQNLEEELKGLKNQQDKLKIQAEEDKVKLEEARQYSYRLERARERLNAEKNKLEMEIFGYKSQMKKTDHTMNDLKADNQKYHKMYQKQKECSDEQAKEIYSLEMKNVKLQSKNSENEAALEKLNKSHENLSRELLEKNNEIREKLLELQSVRHNYEMASKKLGLTETWLESCKEEHKIEMNNLKTLENSLAASQKYIETVLLRVNRLVQQNEAADKNTKRLNMEKNQLDKHLQITVGTNMALIKEITQTRDEVKHVYEAIRSMSNDKDRLHKSVNMLNFKIQKLNKELATKEMVNLTSEKTRKDLETQLKSGKESLVHALNQKDNCNHLLRRTELIIDDLARGNANYMKQTSSLSESILEAEKNAEHLMKQKAKLLDELNLANTELVNKQTLLAESAVKIKEMEAEVENMRKTLNQKESFISNQRLTIVELQNQRNVLGMQCVKKKEETYKMQEKNKVIEDLMNMGNRLYEARLQQIKFLQQEIHKLLWQKDMIAKRADNVENIRSKLGLANSQLVSFQARCYAMEDEPPMSMHHLTQLKSKDYSKYELVMKNQFLVKRLIRKTDEVTALESVLKEKAVILSNMKDLMFHRPGPEIVAQAIGDRKKKEKMICKLKCALAEQNMIHWQMEDTKTANNKLKAKLHEEKKKRLQEQKKCQKAQRVQGSLETQLKLKKCDFDHFQHPQIKSFLPPVHVSNKKRFGNIC